jgi:Predicted amidohydrolase
MESFTITLAQVAPVVLDVEKNMKRALSLLDDCGKRGSSILVLPELFLSGYEIKEAISTEAGAERLERNVNAALPLIADKTARAAAISLSAIRFLSSPARGLILPLNIFPEEKALPCTGR